MRNLLKRLAAKRMCSTLVLACPFAALFNGHGRMVEDLFEIEQRAERMKAAEARRLGGVIDGQLEEVVGGNPEWDGRSA